MSFPPTYSYPIGYSIKIVSCNDAFRKVVTTFIYSHSKSWYAIIANIVLNELDLIIDE